MCMRKMSLFSLFIFIFCGIFPLFAQAREAEQDFGLSINAGVKKKIVKGLSVSVEGELRTENKTQDLNRLTIGASVSYKPIKYFKVDTGYEFIGRYHAEHTSDKDNRIASYWVPRHRFQFSVSGILPIGDFTLSLRECYQMTHSQEATASKWDADTGKALDDKVSAALNEHILRSRLQGEYAIPDSGVTPYVSVEFYDDLADSFALTDIKTTVGVEYEVTKHHSLDFYYRYAAEMGSSSNTDTHLLAVGYQFSF